METDTPQFDLPFRLGPGDEPLVVAQDGIEEVADCVETLLRTELGSIEENPDYGITDPTFTEGMVDLNEIQTAISQWEGDRADTLIDQEPDLLDAFVTRVNLDLKVRSDA